MVPVPSAKEIEDGRVVAWLGYLSVFLVIPYLAQPDNRFSQFHVRQGLALLLWHLGVAFVGIVVMVIGTALGMGTMVVSYGTAAAGAAVPGYGLLPFAVWLISLAVGIVLMLVWALLWLLMFLGVYNAITGRMVELPVVGKTARRFYPSSWKTVAEPMQVRRRDEIGERCSSCGKARGGDGLFCGKCGERYPAPA